MLEAARTGHLFPSISTRRSADVDPLEHARTRIRLLLIAPSLDILGGQAVQAARLLREFRKEASLAVDFLPMNPRLPGRGLLQRVKYVRTASTVIGSC